MIIAIALIVLFVIACIAFDRTVERVIALDRHYRDYLAGKEMDPRD